MNDNTSTIEAAPIGAVTEVSDSEVTEEVVYAKGTWQALLHTSEVKRVAGQKNNKAASALLWQGAQAAIEDWLPNSDNDVSAENLYNEAKAALGGEHRKGDASKIRAVAGAVKTKGLLLSLYPNLYKAYTEAQRLTTTVAKEKAEDEAAEKAVAGIDAPKSSSTPEGAALIVLSKGLDEAARLLLDALGASNEAAHRSFMRAISQEIAGRVKPKAASTVKAGPKAGATQAKTGTAVKPTVKAKAAPVKAKAAPVQTKAAPVKATKAAPVVKGRPVAVKGRPVVAKPVSAAV